jgi:hypothetical protein
MAQLPYTYTICPDVEEPKRFTASCAEMGRLLRNSIKGDLTIDQRHDGLWETWSGTGEGLGIAPIEDLVHALISNPNFSTK